MADYDPYDMGDLTQYAMTPKQDIRAWALNAAARFAADSPLSAGDLITLANGFAGWIETGEHPSDIDEPKQP